MKLSTTRQISHLLIIFFDFFKNDNIVLYIVIFRYENAIQFTNDLLRDGSANPDVLFLRARALYYQVNLPIDTLISIVSYPNFFFIE